MMVKNIRPIVPGVGLTFVNQNSMKAIRDLIWKEKQSRTLSIQSLYHSPTESENSLYEEGYREEDTFSKGN